MRVNPNQPLSGRHAFVTGGGRGIGAEIARALLQQGASVTLAGRDTARLTSTAAALGEHGTVQWVPVDVTLRESVSAAFSRAVEGNGFGRIDILVNNAGQAGSAPFGKTSDALWDQMLAVNLTGTFLCSQVALSGMLQNGWGRIVNVASTAGLTGYGYVAAYCAAKHGVIGLTRALAIEVAAKGVTVNAVCPGYTETDIVEDAVANIVAKTGRSEAEARAELASGNPQKKLVQPQQVADAVAWLCLPGSDAMNGQALAVAGGEIM